MNHHFSNVLLRPVSLVFHRIVPALQIVPKSIVFACLFVLLASAMGPAQDVLDLQLHPSNIQSFSTASPNFASGSGTAPCPGVGTPSFIYNFTTKVEPVNDEIAFQGTTAATNVGVITHLRVTNTVTYGGNKIINRQDWTRIKENPNGIDNTTGIRHYIGLFSQESQQPKGKKPVVTATTEGIITLQEPLFFSSGPLANVANRVAVTSFIGSQPAWLEPFAVSDARTCSFLATGVVHAVDPQYNGSCVADGDTPYHYNGVDFTGNIVSCP